MVLWQGQNGDGVLQLCFDSLPHKTGKMEAPRGMSVFIQSDTDEGWFKIIFHIAHVAQTNFFCVCVCLCVYHLYLAVSMFFQNNKSQQFFWHLTLSGHLKQAALQLLVHWAIQVQANSSKIVGFQQILHDYLRSDFISQNDISVFWVHSQLFSYLRWDPITWDASHVLFCFVFCQVWTVEDHLMITKIWCLMVHKKQNISHLYDSINVNYFLPKCSSEFNWTTSELGGQPISQSVSLVVITMW